MRAFSTTRPTFEVTMLFSKTHEWAKVDTEAKTATLGITHFAQEELGEVVYMDLPAAGDKVAVDEDYGTVESVKATSSLTSPVGGTITDVNTALLDDTALVNASPEDEAWTIKVKDLEIPEGLMTREEYEKYREETEH
ncbi:Glycine cleavage system H protein [Diplonema papillatum]|nr:Glycine cleavage system H protein [Diplonema papillatum]KAJ9444781.1 Glycine cleavage system H protein [Diplonema papillatum]|eukprot:gene8605-13306_t